MTITFHFRGSKLENLHSGLEELYCYDNQISKLENLPSGLEELFCYDNQITKL